MKRLLLLGVVLLVLLPGCAREATAPAVVDDKVLYAATELVDDADAFIAAGEANDPVMLDHLRYFDAHLEGFRKTAGPEQMPEFYEAISAWREGLDKAQEMEPGVMQTRALEDMNSSLTQARRDLDRALDAAGK